MTATTRRCAICASALAGRQTKYCSPLCSARAQNQRDKATGNGSRKRRRYADRRAAWQRENRWRYYDVPTTCERCGAEFNARRGEQQQYCSRSCASGINERTRRAAARRHRAMKRSERSAQGSTGQRIWTAGACERCGRAFLGKWADRYCSSNCATAAGKRRHRARKRGAFVATVSRRRIFERDRWICQICHRPVARTKVVPHPRSPVLDHIVPLAKGGTHEPANVQCAHFLCNSLKSDGAANDQLRLIG